MKFERTISPKSGRPRGSAWSFSPHLLIFLGLLASGFPIPLPAAQPSLPNYFTRAWQTEEGLPHNAVTAVLQTRDGYLWVGTYDGLARFDGVSFTIFDNGNTPEMRNSRVISLFEDDQGTLWIGHETGELTQYRHGKFSSVELDPSWENRKVWAIGANEAGEIWLMNDEGRLAPINGRLLSIPTSVTPQRVAAHGRDSRGTQWVSYDGQLFRIEGDHLVRAPLSDPPSSDYVEGFCPSHDGGLWIVSGGRIRKWDGKKWTADWGTSPWGSGFVSMAIETRSGNLAVGTLEHGLYLLFQNGTVLHFNRENGLPHDWVRCVFEDREGTLWAGTGSGGLVAVRAGKVATIGPPDHWQGRVVLSVTAARDGALWVGTEGAGLYSYKNDQWTHFGEDAGLANIFVWTVSQDADGRIWAGTWGGGVYVQRGDHFERPPGLEEVTVPTPAVLHGRNGVTWIGTGDGLLRYQHDDHSTKWFGKKEGLAFPDVRVVAEDHDGNVWFGMLGGGLGRLQNGVVQQFRKRDGLSSDYVQCLHVDSDGTLWIGTYGGGLNRLKQGRFTSITTAQGLPNNSILDIEADGHGNFWMSSHGGIFRVNRAELHRCADGEIDSISSLSYGKGEGMPSLECSGGLQPPGCRTADGHFLFPTSKGLVVIDPNDAKGNSLEPPVVIEKLLVDGQTVPAVSDEAQPLQLPAGSQRFEFRYTGLSFVAPEKMRFRYRLLGREEGFTDVGGKRTVNYTYIPPGNYEFQVIACNSDGIWNENGARLAFTVQPYFWQRLWFRIFAALGAATALAGSVLFETRRRMRRKLERLERQQAIERERARIAQDIHDNLGASLTRISLLSQSAHGDVDDPAHTTMQLERIYNTARDLTRSLDEIVWAVNPQHDTLDSLASYLGKFAQDFLEPLEIRCRLDLPSQLPAWPLTAEVRHNLFLAFSEALNNAVKHARATEVWLALVIQDSAFLLSVRDNGVGFSPEEMLPPDTAHPDRFPRGNGLINMRQRLAKIGGRCEIQSAPGQGTEVRFMFSMARP